MTTVLDPTNEQKPVARQRSERSAVIDGMQASLRDADLRTSTVNERLTALARDAA